MNKIFKVMGVVIAIVSVPAFGAGASVGLVFGVVYGAFTIVLGAAFYTIGSLMERVDYLEATVNASLAGASSSDNTLPQRQCPKCKTVHDFDYPKCPHCRYQY